MRIIMMISMTTRIIDSFFIQEKAQMQKTFHLDKMKRLLFDNSFIVVL